MMRYDDDGLLSEGIPTMAAHFVECFRMSASYALAALLVYDSAASICITISMGWGL